MVDQCNYCDNGIPLSPGNQNYHKHDGGYIQCKRRAVEARLELLQMSEITIEEIDKLVLEERTSLELASLEVIEKRCIELQNAFELLQKNAKTIKQRHVVALEMYDEKSGRVSKEEIKAAKKSVNVDQQLEEMARILKERGSSKISSIEEKK